MRRVQEQSAGGKGGNEGEGWKGWREEGWDVAGPLSISETKLKKLDLAERRRKKKIPGNERELGVNFKNRPQVNSSTAFVGREEEITSNKQLWSLESGQRESKDG